MLRAADYEKIDDGAFCGVIPGLQGVYANAQSLEAVYLPHAQCRERI
jgi:hypothetical protein